MEPNIKKYVISKNQFFLDNNLSFKIKKDCSVNNNDYNYCTFIKKGNFWTMYIEDKILCCDEKNKLFLNNVSLEEDEKFETVNDDLNYHEIYFNYELDNEYKKRKNKYSKLNTLCLLPKKDYYLYTIDSNGKRLYFSKKNNMLSLSSDKYSFSLIMVENLKNNIFNVKNESEPEDINNDIYNNEKNIKNVKNKKNFYSLGIPISTGIIFYIILLVILIILYFIL